MNVHSMLKQCSSKPKEGKKGGTGKRDNSCGTKDRKNSKQIIKWYT